MALTSLQTLRNKHESPHNLYPSSGDFRRDGTSRRHWSGSVGLATAIAFALQGRDVVGADVDTERVASISRGEPLFFEAGLEDALDEVLKTMRLNATTDTREAVAGADITFLCVGTPSSSDGSMDDSFLREAAKELAYNLSENPKPIVVVKSTVVPGATENVIRPILEASGKTYGLAVNPEFLREGHALEGALHPDRIVLGVDGPDTARRLRDLYAHVSCPIIQTDLRTAEAIKYATNAFLAMKVAFANELADIWRRVGVPYDDVIRAVALDPRINPRSLVPGVGFGGSCIPKDVKALVSASRWMGFDPHLLEAILAQNETQFLQAINLLESELGNLKRKRIALLGLAFKGNTDDVRESRAIPIARTLLERGATVVGYDPVANENFHRMVPEVLFADSLEEALRDADGCILQAEWPRFSKPSCEDFLVPMCTPVVVDGRRILNPTVMKGVRFRRMG